LVDLPATMAAKREVRPFLPISPNLRIACRAACLPLRLNPLQIFRNSSSAWSHQSSDFAGFAGFAGAASFGLLSVLLDSDFPSVAVAGLAFSCSDFSPDFYDSLR
jgi:hypothetical protein